MQSSLWLFQHQLESRLTRVVMVVHLARRPLSDLCSHSFKRRQTVYMPVIVAPLFANLCGLIESMSTPLWSSSKGVSWCMQRAEGTGA